MAADDKIRSYMEELNTLKMGEGAVVKLIACGRSAIEPLRQFLLFGQPGVVNQIFIGETSRQMTLRPPSRDSSLFHDLRKGC
jgi:hypothetical protein